jgi:hypothetical protein
MRTSLRLAAAALVVGLATVPTAVADGAAKAPKVVTPTVSTAAWYQPDPLCAVALLCGVIKLPAISPYPKGTYHVSATAGRETGRAFIAVHLSKLATTAHGGTLTVPVDTSATDGSLAPQTAQVEVCVVYQAFTSANGAYVEDGPSANCLPSAQAKYVAKPKPHLVANLKRFAGKLTGVKGFALVPTKLSATSTWNLAFQLPTAKAQKAQLPAVKLLVGAVAQVTKSTPKPTPTATHHSQPTAGGSGDPSSGLGAPAVGPMPTLPSTTSVGKVHNPKPEVAAPNATRSAARFVTIGYQYPEVWLLPILGLVLVPFILRSLTRDLTRR